jgi:hypothetical protein
MANNARVSSFGSRLSTARKPSDSSGCALSGSQPSTPRIMLRKSAARRLLGAQAARQHATQQSLSEAAAAATGFLEYRKYTLHPAGMRPYLDMVE